MNSAAAMLDNLLAETGMEWQAASKELQEGDRTEAAMIVRLCELAEHVPGKLGQQIRHVAYWLRDYDPGENARHRAFWPAGQHICRKIEGPKTKPASRCNARRAG